MQRVSMTGVVALGALLVLFAGISPADMGTNSMGGDEALSTASPEIDAHTEPWERFDAPEIDSHAEPWERFDAVETGAIPKPAREELSLDNYYPD